nr:ATP synthase F0 subunit 8 [Onukigallia sp.]
MPQMAPMWWTMLMMIFNFMLMLTIVTNYFNFKSKSMMMINKNINKKMYWKW